MKVGIVEEQKARTRGVEIMVETRGYMIHLVDEDVAENLVPQKTGATTRCGRYVHPFELRRVHRTPEDEYKVRHRPRCQKCLMVGTRKGSVAAGVEAEMQRVLTKLDKGVFRETLTWTGWDKKVGLDKLNASFFWQVKTVQKQGRMFSVHVEARYSPQLGQPNLVNTADGRLAAKRILRKQAEQMLKLGLINSINKDGTMFCRMVFPVEDKRDTVTLVTEAVKARKDHFVGVMRWMYNMRFQALAAQRLIGVATGQGCSDLEVDESQAKVWRTFARLGAWGWLETLMRKHHLVEKKNGKNLSA